ncbi:MAG TPA: polyphosphate kinase 2 family protein [Vicinamibacteria bacterium]|nr:polyphosphate kinase 2 family protein [Vicinamibacteria bacterium]HRB12251.1 polyphosphate kinase 2 family protein [Vicinamibacteria bacterium]
MTFDIDLPDLRVRPGSKVRLKSIDTDSTGSYESKETAKKHLRKGVEELRRMQEMLYAQDQQALLLVFQAMDGAGKDSTVEHVMSGVNPQGCQVFSFKSPSSEELDHDFLWRTAKCLPERGRIGIFNRSYYEETLVVRVHPEYLDKQRLPRELASDRIWDHRFEDIRNWEKYLTRNGTVIRKFYLHVSKDEQKKRFLARLEEPEKNWKFNAGDVKERALWDEYQRAYEDMLGATSTNYAPWHIIPADHKWFARLAVADIIIDTLRSMKLHYPKISKETRAGLDAAKQALETE